MPFHYSKKSVLTVGLLTAFAVGLTYFSFTDRTANAPSSAGEVGRISTAIADDASSPVTTHTHDHENCAHATASAPVSQITTVPSLDDLFKSYERQGPVSVDRGEFDFVKTAQKGDQVAFELAGRSFSGVLSAARVAEAAQSYAVTLADPAGRVVINNDGNNEFSAYVVYNGDSRALKLFQESVYQGAETLELEVVSVSDLLCGPEDMVYQPLSQQLKVAGNLAPSNNPNVDPNIIVGAPPALTNVADSDFVIYCDFDGESVVDDPTWGSIEALPHPRAEDAAWVEFVWERVVEDFAPFDITVTTNPAVFNAADEDKRLQVIITPTDDAAEGAGGVARLFSFRSASPIVWVFNLEEYAAADTISHEVGHAMGLYHDGELSTAGADEYYGGHGTGATSWAPIMGAPWSDEGSTDYLEFVTQWSAGEYTNADNQEDDISIIGGSRNGFGLKADDYSDSQSPTGDLLVGGVTINPDGSIDASGVIGTRADVDVFSFAVNPGMMNITVAPLDVMSTGGEDGSDRPGANLAVDVTLLDASGNVLVSVTGSSPSALVTYDSPGEKYYLVVTGAGREVDPTVGFSDYASLGHYTISGTVTPPPLVVFGGDKLNISIVDGETETSLAAGTDYGFAKRGELATETFALQNISTADIYDLSVSFGPGSEFSLESSLPTKIVPGASPTITLGYTPNAIGLSDDTVTISYLTTELTEVQTVEFALSGTGTSTSGQDNYENNDVMTSSGSYNMTPYEDVWLSDHLGLANQADNVDWYRIVIDSDDKFIQVNFSYDGTEVSGPLDMTLRNSRGELKATAGGDTGAENIGFVIPEGYTNTVYYIKVKGPSGAITKVAYDMKWIARPFYDEGGDDLYEENDSKLDAYDLGLPTKTRLSEILGPAVQYDEDWYAITVPQDPYIRNFYVGCEYDNTVGNLTLEVTREIFLDPHQPELGTVEQELGISDSNSGYEFVWRQDVMFIGDLIAEYDEEADPPQFLWAPIGNTIVSGLAPGTYYIRVTGGDVGNVYDLVFGVDGDDQYELIDYDLEGERIENDDEENPYELEDKIIGNWLSSIDGNGVLAAYRSEPGDDLFENASDEDWFHFTYDKENVNQLVLDVINIGVGSDYFGIEIQTMDGDVVAEYSEREIRETEYTLIIDAPEEDEYLIRLVPTADIGYLAAYDFMVTLNYDALIVDDAVEDNYEQNDDVEHFYDLKPYAGEWLASVDGLGTLLDPDWYEIEVPEGATYLEIECAYSSPDALIELVLIRAEDDLFGKKTPASSFFTEGESYEIWWSDPDPGRYRVGVIGDYVGTSYNVRWNVRRADDNYEVNNTIDTAYDMSAIDSVRFSKIDGLGIQADDDWYEIAVPADTALLRVELSPVVRWLTIFDEDADIDLELWHIDDEGNEAAIARSVNTGPFLGESLNVPDLPEGTYYLRAYYGDAGNEYDLWWGTYTQGELDALYEDNYEFNGFLETPFVLGNSDQMYLSEVDGLGTQGDDVWTLSSDDWYQIEVSPNSLGVSVDCTFTHADGDIDIELYSENESGILNLFNDSGSVLASSTSTTDNEFLSYDGPLAAGVYYIRVFGANRGNEYDFYWVDKTKDLYESNDTRGDAYDLSDAPQESLSTEGLATQEGVDWYKIATTAENSTIVLDLNYSHADGDINMGLYDLNGALIVETATTEDFEYIKQLVSYAGDYYVKVTGDNRYNDYDLFWNALPEDAYEENDDLASAADISAEEGEDLEGVVLDDDWFVITPPLGAVSVQVDLLFVHASGDTNIDIYDSDDNLLGSGVSTTDNEAVNFQVDPFGGQYYLHVYGNDGNLGNPYTLTWTSSTSDAYEGNNSIYDAYDLSAEEGVLISASAGFATSKDEDWYVINVSGSNLVVNCLFNHADGNIDIELYHYDASQDPDVIWLADSISSTDNEFIDQAIVDGVYYIRVYGDLAGNPYDLIWTTYGADDSFEANNDLASAGDLTGVEYELTSDLIQLDPDWFEVAVEVAGDVLLVAYDFDASGGDLEIDIFDAAENPLGSAITEGGPDQIQLTGLAVGSYFVRVTGTNVGNSYSLSWSSSVEDAYEENDTSATPYDLSSNADVALSTLSGLGAQYDSDWYSVVVASDHSVLEASLTSDVDEGVMSLVIYDSVGTELDSSTVGGDQSLSLDELDAGTYLIEVSGPDLGAPYDLIWNAILDDNYEDNESIAEAYDLTAASSPLSSVAGLGLRVDADFYKIESSLGDVRLSLDCSFTHVDGDIGLEVYDEDGGFVSGVDSSDDNETLVVTISPEAKVYYVSVFGAENTGSAYDLSWTFDSIDSYESNQDDTTATDLSGDEGGLLSESGGGFATQGDEDWYLVTVPVGSQILNVDVTFTHADGDINLEIVDDTLNSLGVSSTTDDNEALSVAVDPLGGDYYIVISGDNQSNVYDLVWTLLLDDNYEENDTDETTFFDLTSNEGETLEDLDGLGYQYDKDYYRVTLPVGAARLKVELSHMHADGDIDLIVYDPSMAILGDSLGSDDLIELDLTLDEAGGNYTFLVYGADAGNAYDLVWSAIVEDNYESNNDDTEAFDLSAHEGVTLESIDGFGTKLDEDWFQITTPADVVLVDVVLAGFVSAEGNLELEVLDSTLASIETSESTNNNESISFPTDPAGALYYIRVYGENTGNAYDLMWSISGDDAYEMNDFVDVAYELFDNEGEWLDQLDGYATQVEEDWYAVVVSDLSTSLDIQCKFTHADGDIDLELYQFVTTPVEELDDPAADERKPVLLERAITSSDLEQITYSVSEAGIYFIRVYRGNSGNSYNLLWDDGVDDTAGDAVYVDDYQNGDWEYIPRELRASALLASPNANDDGDALPNWAEYALGLDATKADYAVVGQSVIEVEGVEYFQFEFLRTKEAVNRDYEFIVQESGNMVFDGSGTADYVRTESVDSDIERVIYRSSEPISAVSNCFFRLKVLEPVK